MAEIQIAHLKIESVYWPENERKHFDEGSLGTLADSIRIHGIKQPIGVVAEPDGRYRGLWGERRSKGAAKVGLATIPAIIHAAPKDEIEAAEIRLVENVARESLSPMELAAGLSKLMAGGNTAVQVSARIGMSPAAVSRSLSLLKLSAGIQQQIQRGEISAAAGYGLAQIDDLKVREEMARQVADGKMTRDGLAARRKFPVKSASANESSAPISRATAKLGDGKSVTVYAPNLNMDVLIETIEHALSRARQARSKQLTLPTFLRILRDTAQS